jgi:hypothetical protein
MTTDFFSKPYPRDHSIKRLLVTSVCIGVFIGLFLIIFQPFESNTIPGRTFRILFLGGYGLLTIIVSIAFGLLLRFLFPKWVEEKNWTTGREILGTLSIILIVSVLNMLYTNIVFHRTFDSVQLPYWAGITLLVSIIPVSFSVMLRQGRMSRESEGMAEVMNTEIGQRKNEIPPAISQTVSKWVFTSENEKDKIETSENDLFFIESADNYSTFYTFENGEVKKQMLRGSLKKMEEQVQDESLYRCHRTYIVNLSKVKSVSGNAQGYRLHFTETEFTVPVSRNLGKELKEKLHT